MPSNWKRLVEASDGVYVEDDFKQALYQLVTQQCLYVRHKRQSVSYRIVSAHRDSFSEAVDLMGLRLVFNDRLEFCCVLQESTKPTQMDLQETRMILTLRHLYHIKANEGNVDHETGSAVVSLPELYEAHKTLTQVDLESTSVKAIKDLLRTAWRSGLARDIPKQEGDSQPFAIEILASIAVVINETAVARFGAALKASLMGLPQAVAAEEASDAVDSEDDAEEMDGAAQ
jgi:hypothetical protein